MRLRVLEAIRPGHRRSEAVADAMSSVSPDDRAIIERALPYTMTGVPRVQALVDSVRYLVNRQISGAFVECGVWRGGSVLAMIATLQQMQADPRDIWLYDTFEGMTEPTEHDVSDHAPPPLETWNAALAEGKRPWAESFGHDVFNEADVRRTLLSTGYPQERIHFVRGPVEETIPGTVPGDELALLRLDTDWYESTSHELRHLYPRLREGGVLIIDDYGHFDGARKAVDEYFEDHPKPLLYRIDYTARLAVKL